MMTLLLPQPRRLHSRGFSLVELMIALALGLIMSAVMASMYMVSSATSRRQDQLSGIQQNVRSAFEFLTADARAAGLMGCVTDSERTQNLLGSSDLKTNFMVGVEGYDANTTPAYPLVNSDTQSDWKTNKATGSAQLAIPIWAGESLTKGSDVLVLRNASGGPVRLTDNTLSNTTSLKIESIGAGKCSDNTTTKVSGFCAGSYGLISSCSNARVFAVQAATSGALTLSNALGAPIYDKSSAEVFPLQTVAYYVKVSAAGEPSLYRRVMDGNVDDEQELIEGVESMQVSYGVDTTAPIPDGIIDGNAYLTADEVTNWQQVAAVRISLLLRSKVAAPADVAMAASAKVNGVEVTFPTTSPKFDRRVFTTTVAIRNKIAF